jgi:hypothetical protein
MKFRWSGKLKYFSSFLSSFVTSNTDDMDDDMQEDYKVRVSSDFDRLVAFATEMNKSRDASPKRESGPSDYRHMKDEARKMKHEIPADLSSERRMRMIEESRKRAQ